MAPIREHVPSGSASREPLRTDPDFVPKSGILSWIFPGIKAQYEAAAEAAYLFAHAEWASDTQEAHRKWSAAVKRADQNYSKSCESYEGQLLDWEKRKQSFEAARAADNEKVSAFQKRYQEKDREAVVEYVDMVLSRSIYPGCFPKVWQLDLMPETGIAVLDYDLPSLDSLPNIKGVKYIQSRDVFETSFLRESDLAQLYDTSLYQTCLRTLYEIFKSDTADAITSVTFNGWVDFIDKTTGKEARSCILSLQAEKAPFLEINLEAVEPKACFRALKGVGSSKLAGMSAITPILRFNKVDKRFVASRDVIDEVLASTNLAAIPWEDFEHLVRDVFEKEFSSGGGEVRITRASRDHGVDAIAFDPDPIRGGKIVIQAKRYTNVVGVAAVRDLYGTLINEGATKGILVTTAQYGPDSYDFAKGKPITLLDGGNLLSLLAKHGHRARIDLAEAKKLGALRDDR